MALVCSLLGEVTKGTLMKVLLGALNGALLVVNSYFYETTGEWFSLVAAAAALFAIGFMAAAETVR